ncbi:MAG: adenylate/guanylate cyclase domain-containing protein [Planctomycetota bacterium]|jgi:TolB-like protein/class 3 adenylate cyclase/Flp pilus assembly protein TadD
MNEERARRKLSGILSADAVGYSRLMQEDEAATIRTLEDSKRLMSELIQQFKGRIVDAPGDNLLAEFGSVVDATECAVKIQGELKAKNAKLPDNRKMEFRIGVNLGDVVEEADRIYGDGVNIAARIEELAEPGGVCISRTAYDHVKNKLELGYEYLGEHSVKNIAEPVRVYRVLMEPEAVGKVIGEKRFLGRISRKAAISAIISLVIVAGGLIGWNVYLHQAKKIEPASLERMAYPLPDKPSIAVLPFDNLSGGPEQEYFSDGITEEIITALSKVPNLFVIARNSTFTYKGKPVKVQQVSEELGVQYVLEGSVRRAEDQVRITAQLVDAIKGHHLWAERYDGTLGDVFDLQDKVTQKIVAALAVKLTPDREENIADRGTKNVKAWDAYLQASALFWPQTPENLNKAVAFLEQAIELDPSFGRAHAKLAAAYTIIISRVFDKDLGISNAHSLRKKHFKLALKNPSATAHETAAWAQIFKGEIDKAMDHAKHALALRPNNDGSYLAMGGALIYAGRPDEAITYIGKAMRINPKYPAMWLWWLGVAQFCDEQLQEAATTSERARKRNPHLAAWFQISAYEHLGRKKEAQAALSEYLKVRGWEKAPPLTKIMPWYQFKNQANRELLAEGLRKAGLK